MARDEAYRLAEERIEEARRLGAVELNLSYMSLTELPESLREITHLQSLALSGNQLTVLPEWIAQFTQLQLLDLSSSKLLALPVWLGQLTQLQSLDLSHNQVTVLPDWISQLTQLQSLALSRNQLTALPEWLGQLTQLQLLNLSHNQLTTLPEWIDNLRQLQSLDLSDNQLTTLPEWIGNLRQLQSLDLSDNQLTTLPEWIGNLRQLQSLDLSGNQLTALPELLGQCSQLQSLFLGDNPLGYVPSVVRYLTGLHILNLWRTDLQQLPDWFGELNSLIELVLSENNIHDLPNSFANISSLRQVWFGWSEGGNPLDGLPNVLRYLYNLREIGVMKCHVVDLPTWVAELEHLNSLDLDDNPLNPELAAAYEQGLDAVKAYLRAKAAAQITLNEAKLILVGEGEVGKSSLLGALRDDEWEEGRPTTHGIEIKCVQVIDPDGRTEITLNAWDFGGQRVYRPTHQLFFSAPAVYLVVWKPREGPQQGFVKEWIKLVKHREPDAKILVVATHGGPQQRQPDIDRQELWDLFGKDTVLDFFHVESKPDENGERHGIEELKQAIARVAAALPEMGRSVPERWQEVREELAQTEAAYLPLEQVFDLCRAHQMDDEEARLFITVSHRLGHLIHYQHDPTLRDIVVLKPDWLSIAISFVLDDQVTRQNHGMVRFSRLRRLWNDPARAAEYRYPPDLHPIFVRLMERFDLSYRVAALPVKDEADEISLIAQLVPDTRPELIPAWAPRAAVRDVQQQQICRIVDAQNGQSATAEGLFYQLIVRLHKYSLGRANYTDSVHWQRGLVLDDGYNGRALLEHIGNDMRITVRAAYPERFLSVLTSEVKYLVDSFWTGLRCDVMVPCVAPCGKEAPGTGLYDVESLIESKQEGRPEFPCPTCNQWQQIDALLRNAPAAQPVATEDLFAEFAEVRRALAAIYQKMQHQHTDALGRFDQLDANDQRLLSKVDASYTSLIQALTDEAKEGPRLFSLVPVARTRLHPKEWTSARFRLILWCEHSRLPLPLVNTKDKTRGVYELDLTRDWFKKAAPFLKVLTGTLTLVLPVASSGIKLALDETTYKSLENYFDFGKEFIDASLSGSEKIGDWLAQGTATDLEHGEAIRAHGGVLREFHALLKATDPGFGGLIRVMNKRQEFLWVHPQFEKEY